MNKEMIENFVHEWCMGTNIEIIDVSDWDGKDFIGLEFNFYDHLDKCTDFESDVNELIDNLDDFLDANIFICNPDFEYFNDIDEDGNEIKNHHCFLKIGKEC